MRSGRIVNPGTTGGGISLATTAADAIDVTSGRDAPSTVMVVEDYTPLRVLCARLLRRAGYSLIDAPSADDALATLTDGAEPAIVITDLNMPGDVTGEAFIEHLRENHPDIGLVVITGETETDAINAGSGELMLTKPFSNEALLDAVAKVLAAKG